MIIKKLMCCCLIAAAGFFSQSCAKKVAETGFVLVNGTEIQSLDPTHIQGVPEHRVYNALFEGLVTHDPKDSQPRPGVAESWDLSEGGKVVTFKLRSDAVWSDGTPIDAQNIVDSWLYHLNPVTADEYSYMPAMVIEGAELYNTKGGRPEDVQIRAVDTKTFEVRLVGSVPYAVEMMAHYAFSPLPMHVINKTGADWIKKGNIVNNGPFVLEEWIPNDKLVVVKNDKYWNKNNVYLSKITFLPIEDTNTAYQSYKNGEADWIYNPPIAIIDELKLRKDFHVSAQAGTYFYYINTKHPVLKDPRIRKALSMSFDREELVQKVTKGGQIPAFSFVPPMPGYTGAGGQGFNIEAARKYLADAGYPGGNGLPAFSLIYNTLDNHKTIAEYLQHAWKENIGVNIELNNMEWKTFLVERKSDKLEIGRAGWISDYADPQNFLDLFVSGAGNNDGKYSNPEYDRLIRQAAAMPGGLDRAGVMREAEKIAIEDDQVVIPVYFYVSQHLIDLDKWEGWYPNVLDIHPWVGIKHK